MNYIEEVVELCSTKFDVAKIPQDILHGVVGCVTESGEMADALKKALFYGKDFDYTNLKEEMGDLMWYLALLCNATGTTFEEIQELNIKKLHARYKAKKFSVEECAVRDLAAERVILESKEVQQ